MPLPVLSEIFKRATVLMPDIHLNDLLRGFVASSGGSRHDASRFE
jgi:hypothetical protein